MPFLKHIIEPLLRKELDDIHTELPPPQAGAGRKGGQAVRQDSPHIEPRSDGTYGMAPEPQPEPAPPQVAPDQQLEQWVAKKQADYKRFGATPEQVAAWEKYDRSRYTSFLNKQQMTDTVKASHEPALAEALGHAAVGVGDAARAASGRAYMSTLGQRNISAPAQSPIESVDPRLQTPENQQKIIVGNLPSTGGYLAFKRGAAGLYPVPQVGEIPEPVSPDSPKFTTEPSKPGKKKGLVLDLPEGPIGYAEDGQSIDRNGKKLGFLQQDQGAVRFADRQGKDFSLEDNDAAAQDRMQALYGSALQAVKDNEGKYPAGYFKGKSDDEKKNIKAGVQALMKNERGTRI